MYRQFVSYHQEKTSLMQDSIEEKAEEANSREKDRYI